jgi:hypothetical protein
MQSILNKYFAFKVKLYKSNSLKFDRNFGGTSFLHIQGLKVKQMRNQHEAGSKNDMPVAFQLSTLLYTRNSENRTLHNHCRENLRS